MTPTAVLLLLGVGIFLFIGILFILFRLFQGVGSTSKSSDINNPYYSVYPQQVLYRNKYRVSANPQEFSVYDETSPFGHTDSHVFFQQYPVEGLKVKDFTILGKAAEFFYSTDGKIVLINNTEIIGAQSESFRFFAPSAFSADDSNVYYKGKKIEGAQASTFQILQGKYARDSHQYYLGRYAVAIEDIPHNIVNTHQSSI